MHFPFFKFILNISLVFKVCLKDLIKKLCLKEGFERAVMEIVCFSFLNYGDYKIFLKTNKVLKCYTIIYNRSIFLNHKS